jgi:hypothetical protein
LTVIGSIGHLSSSDSRDRKRRDVFVYGGALAMLTLVLVVLIAIGGYDGGRLLEKFQS